MCNLLCDLENALYDEDDFVGLLSKDIELGNRSEDLLDEWEDIP